MAVFSRYLPELLDAFTMKHPVTIIASRKPARLAGPKNRPTIVGSKTAIIAGKSDPLSELVVPVSSSLLPMSRRATLLVIFTELISIPVSTKALHAPTIMPQNTLTAKMFMDSKSVETAYTQNIANADMKAATALYVLAILRFLTDTPASASDIFSLSSSPSLLILEEIISEVCADNVDRPDKAAIVAKIEQSPEVQSANP